MSDGNNVLEKMLDRLLAALVNGPGLNCRPYASRQRLDLSQVSRLKDVSPENVLCNLLDDDHCATLKAKVPMPKGQAGGKRSKRSTETEPAGERESSQTQSENGDHSRAFGRARSGAGDKAWIGATERFLPEATNDRRGCANLRAGHRRQRFESRLSAAEPSAGAASLGLGSTRSAFAPIAFIPVSLALKRGATQSADLSCRGEGIDLVVPNTALLAWIEQQTGKSAEQLDADEEGQHPWKEICSIVAFVCDAMDVALPEMFKVPAIVEAERPAPQHAESQGTPPDSHKGAMDSASATAITPSSGNPGEGRGGGRPEDTPVARTAPSLTLPRSTGGGDNAASSGRIEYTSKKDGEINPALRKEVSGTTGFVPQEDLSGRTGFIPPPAVDGPAPPDPLETLKLVPAPKSEESPDEPAIICSAVLGLFPMANQGLLRDTQAMLAGEGRAGRTGRKLSQVQTSASNHPPVPDRSTSSAPPGSWEELRAGAVRD